MTWRLTACCLLQVSCQDLFLSSNIGKAPLSGSLPINIATPPPAKAECPPLKWIKESFSGAFILNYTDDTWGAYMTFLGVSKELWPTEFNASDIWQYTFFDNSFMMNHTIPAAKFHLKYEASLNRVWEKNPYPYVTPAGFDKNASVDLSKFRNYFDPPGTPLPDSCWALRTDMPVVSNHTGTSKEYVVSFWRELTSPSDIRCTLYVYDAKTNETIEPWKSQMQDAKPYPGYSYRYFRRTVQSFDDIQKRLWCAPTGLRDGTYFC